MKKTLVAALFCVFFMTSDVAAMAPLMRQAPTVGPEACWTPEAKVMANIRSDCAAFSGDAFEVCFIRSMQKYGAPREAVVFTKSIGNLGYMQALQKHGPVDVAYVKYPFRANENQAFLLVNGTPPLIDVDDMGLLSAEKLKDDARFRRIRQQFPAVGLWPGDRFEAEYPLSENTPGGGQRFIVRYRLLNGCRACELIGYVRYAFEFDRTARFLGTKYLGVERLTTENIDADTSFRDASKPVHVNAGQTFKLTLKSNPTTGYSWDLTSPLDESIIRFVGKEYQPDKSAIKLVGAGGVEIWTFKAVGKGEALIDMKYVRPWEKDIAPAGTAKFIVIAGDDTGK